MSACTLQFFRDQLPAGASLPMADALPRVLYLRSGELTVRSGGVVATLGPNSAWHGSQTCDAAGGKEGAEIYRWELRRGADPVLALASATEPTAFAGVMILPAEMRGKSSIRYVLAEDQDKPKRQTYQLFVDEPVDCV